MMRGVLGGAVALIAATLLGACGSDGVEADPTVAAFVGIWDADSLTMTNDANPAQVANVLAAGTFVIVVEPSGQYTATITVLTQPFTEIGDIDVVVSTLELNKTFPPPPSTDASTFAFVGDDYVILDGATEFDFNSDGTPEAAQAHIELRRRP
jgi:ABC-type glycerol-3-phosphate transport system substrate-binding protein